MDDPVCGMWVDDKSPFKTKFEGKIYVFCSAGCREKFLQEKLDASRQNIYDLIIVGGGPAGLTAGTFAATLRMKALLIAASLGGQAVDSTKIENYMGFDFITGPELIDKFQHQLIHSHFIDHRIADVEAMERMESGFRVRTFSGETYFASAVLIATGMARCRLGVPGEEELQRRGIFYGNLNDYFFLHDEDVAIIGGGNSALQMAENLRQEARRIHLVARSALTADEGVIERIRNIANLTCYEGYETVEFTGKNQLDGIVIRNRETLEILSVPLKGAFIAIGLQANSALVAGLIELNRKQEIPIHPDCSTACSGLFAAGDVTDAYGKRIIIAAGEGAKAALAARAYLLHLDRQPVREKGRL